VNTSITEWIDQVVFEDELPFGDHTLHDKQDMTQRTLNSLQSKAPSLINAGNFCYRFVTVHDREMQFFLGLS
jgi:hypothetical protein